MSSDACYSIKISLDPHSKLLPWDARIYRLSDGELVFIVHGSTISEAEIVALRWIAEESNRPATDRTLYANEDGIVVDAPEDDLQPVAGGELRARIAAYGCPWGGETA